MINEFSKHFNPDNRKRVKKINFEDQEAPDLSEFPISTEGSSVKKMEHSLSSSSFSMPFTFNQGGLENFTDFSNLCLQKSLSSSLNYIRIKETDNEKQDDKFASFLKMNKMCEETESIDFQALQSQDSKVSSSNCLASVNPNIVEQYESQIPILKFNESRNIQYISAQTVIERLEYEKQNKDTNEQMLLVDCRYSYEYDGGHIVNSVNIQNPNDIEKMLFNDVAFKINNTKKPLLVFYCEFSQKRSPEIYDYVRKCDRRVNTLNFPQLTYPDIYILQSGYSSFYDKFQDNCNGQYVPMESSEHKQQYKLQRNQLKGWWNDIKNERPHMKKRKSTCQLPDL